jgi:hypothetical protein
MTSGPNGTPGMARMPLIGLHGNADVVAFSMFFTADRKQ